MNQVTNMIPPIIPPYSGLWLVVVLRYKVNVAVQLCGDYIAELTSSVSISIQLLRYVLV